MLLLGEDFPDEFNENAYDLVATIDIINGPTPLTFEDAQVSLEKAYELSQNINNSWLKNPGVVIENRYRREKKYTQERTIRETNPKGCRSTSMGDVIELDGVKYMCEDLGWKAMTEEHPLSAAELLKKYPVTPLSLKENQVIAYKAKLKDSDERQWQTYRVHTHGDKWNARIIINSAGAFDDACIFEEEIITNVHTDKIIILE